MQDTTPGRAEFEAQLASEGYDEIVVVQRPPNMALDSHAHTWDAKALILEGEITIDCGAGERCYRPGEVFEVARGTPHTERFGPQGVSFVAGRRH